MLKRTVTGVVGIALAALFITLGSYPFFFIVSLLTFIGWREYCSAFDNINVPMQKTTGLILLTALLVVANRFTSTELLGVVMLGSMLLLLGALSNFDKGGFSSASISVAGFIYIGLSFSHLILLRAYGQENIIETVLGNFTVGEAFMWLMFIGTWANDSFAYFVGSTVGKQPLCEGISPKKTVEGFTGGVIGTTALVFLIGHFFFGFEFLYMTPLGIALAVFGSLGDLVESTFKRYAKIKDSGNLIPGHGGVLDRFDGVMFNAPLVYYLALILT